MSITHAFQRRWAQRAKEAWRELEEDLGLKTNRSLERSMVALEDAVSTLSGQLRQAKWQGDELYALCPFHDDRHVGSFSVNRTGAYYCFVCGAQGGIHKLMHRLGVKDQEVHEMLRGVDFDLLAESGVSVTEDVQEMKVIPEGVLAGFDLLPRRLIEKGHSPQLLERLDIRLDFDRMRILFPVRRSTGEIVAIQSRGISEDPGQIRWKFYKKELQEILSPEIIQLYGLENYEPPRKTVFFNEHNVFMSMISGRTSRPLVITEGPGHCLRVIATGFPGIACFGTQLGSGQRIRLTETLLRVMEMTRQRPSVIIATDGDRPGRLSAAKIALDLVGRCDVSIARIPKGHDPEDLSVKELRSLLMEAPAFVDVLREPSEDGRIIQELVEEVNSKRELERRRRKKKADWIERQKKEAAEQGQKGMGTIVEHRARHRQQSTEK